MPGKRFVRATALTCGHYRGAARDTEQDRPRIYSGHGLRPHGQPRGAEGQGAL